MRGQRVLFNTYNWLACSSYSLLWRGEDEEAELCKWWHHHHPPPWQLSTGSSQSHFRQGLSTKLTLDVRRADIQTTSDHFRSLHFHSRENEFNYLRLGDPTGDPVSSPPPGHGGGRSGSHSLTSDLMRLPGWEGLGHSQQAEGGWTDWKYEALLEQGEHSFKADGNQREGIFLVPGELCQSRKYLKWLSVLD